MRWLLLSRQLDHAVNILHLCPNLYMNLGTFELWLLLLFPVLCLLWAACYLSIWTRNKKDSWAMGGTIVGSQGWGVLTQAWAWRAWQLSCWQFGWGYPITIWLLLPTIGFIYVPDWTHQNNSCSSHQLSSSCHQSSDYLPSNAMGDSIMTTFWLLICALKAWS